MAQSAETTLVRARVYDPVLRVLHWALAGSILLLVATAWLSEFLEEGLSEKAVWLTHISLGYVFAGALLARIVWGVVGPRHARFTALFHARVWAETLRRRRLVRTRAFGHDPYASLAYLALYAALIVAAVTGLGLAAVEHGAGPLAPWLFDRVGLEEIIEEPHEVMQFVILGFVVMHIGALILHERLEKIPLAQAMISGYQYRSAESADADESTEGERK